MHPLLLDFRTGRSRKGLTLQPALLLGLGLQNCFLHSSSRKPGNKIPTNSPEVLNKGHALGAAPFERQVAGLKWPNQAQLSSPGVLLCSGPQTSRRPTPTPSPASGIRSPCPPPDGEGGISGVNGEGLGSLHAHRPFMKGKLTPRRVFLWPRFPPLGRGELGI